MMEFTFEKSSWADKIEPSNKSGWYTYMNDVEGEKYFVITGKAKSLATESFSVDGISDIEILINGQYKFSGNIQVEETDRHGFSDSIKPLQESVIIVYASITDEAYKICKDAKVSIKIQSDTENAGFSLDEDKPYEYYTLLFNN